MNENGLYTNLIKKIFNYASILIKYSNYLEDKFVLAI